MLLQISGGHRFIWLNWLILKRSLGVLAMGLRIRDNLFRDTPLNHIWHAKYGQVCQILYLTCVHCIWASQIWSSAVSLKRSFKMQFRYLYLMWIRPPSYDYILFWCVFPILISMYLSRLFHKNWQFVQYRWVKHPQFPILGQKCRDLRFFLG